MSLHVWACRCGRRWYQFRKAAWDSTSAPTVWCPGCQADLADLRAQWGEL
jgi:hypothetical protein